MKKVITAQLLRLLPQNEFFDRMRRDVGERDSQWYAMDVGSSLRRLGPALDAQAAIDGLPELVGELRKMKPIAGLIQVGFLCSDYTYLLYLSQPDLRLLGAIRLVPKKAPSKEDLACGVEPYESEP